MKKISIVSLASFLFLLIASAVARLTRHSFTDIAVPLVIGVIILLVSGLAAVIGRRATWVNLLCIFISGTAMGLLIRAWYMLRGLENSFGVMVLVCLAEVLYLWVFFALTRLPFIRGRRKTMIALGIVYGLVSAIVYLVVMLNTDTTFISTFGYYMIFELAFIFAMCMEVQTRAELIRNLTLSTYSVFATVILVLIMVLIVAAADDCSCDDCDGCDGCCDGCGGGDVDKKKKKKAGDSINISVDT